MRRLVKYFAGLPEGPMKVGEIVLVLAASVMIGRGLLLGAEDLAASTRSYESRRNEGAFLSLDMQRVPQTVDRQLSATTPIALGLSLSTGREFGADFWYRATYVFYPRRIATTAAHTLEVGRRGEGVGVHLGDLAEERQLALMGPPDPHPGSAGSTETRLDPLAMVISIASLCGLGFVPRFISRIGAGSVSEQMLSGVLVIAVGAHLTTWLQHRAPWRFLFAAGLVLSLAGAIRAVASGRTSPRSGPWPWANPWILLPFLVAGLGIARSVSSPVTEWDGRFVWLFHGKQLFFRGFMDAAESAVLGPLQPTYPLLSPSLYAFGSSFSESFNERTAVFLGVVFHAMVGLATARLAMSAAGAMRGVLFAALTTGLTMAWTTEAYADGLLASLLILEFLAFCYPEEESLGWLALACAALTKREGLVLGLMVALIQKGHRAWKPALLAVLPALIHTVWCRVIGLAHELDAPRLPLDLLDLANRAALILRKGGGVAMRNQVYILAAAAFTWLLWSWFRKRLPRRSIPIVRLVVSLCAFIFVTFMVTPQPLLWHLETALPRLALHPVCFALLAAFTLSRSGSKAQNSGESSDIGLTGKGA